MIVWRNHCPDRLQPFLAINGQKICFAQPEPSQAICPPATPACDFRFSSEAAQRERKCPLPVIGFQKKLTGAPYQADAIKRICNGMFYGR